MVTRLSISLWTEVEVHNWHKFYCHDSMSNVHHITSKFHHLSASSAVAARLAQSVEHQTFNQRVMGSSPILGDFIFVLSIIIYMKNLLDSDWLRAVQFNSNTSAKSVTPVQITHRNSGDDDWKTKGNYVRQWWRRQWFLCRSFEREKKMASRKIFRHFLCWELYSASCRLRLQIYELFNELTS